MALPLVGSFSTWVTLTFAGLAMGMIIFIIASGLTLVFGLMDVLNFGHGVFITLGAFLAVTVLGRACRLDRRADVLLLNLARGGAGDPGGHGGGGLVGLRLRARDHPARSTASP